MTESYPGRRLRCDECGEKLVESEAYEHAKMCESTVSYPYHPDWHTEGEQAKLNDFDNGGDRT